MAALARAVILTNYHEVARFVGLEPYRMLVTAGLKPAALNDPDNWLPGRRVLSLIDESAAESRRDDFGILLGQCRTFTSLGPLSLLLKHEPTVRDIILAAVEYRSLLNDLIHIVILEDGDDAVVEWSLIPGLQSCQGINLIAAIVYKVISEALEFTWTPDCIHFRHAAPRQVETFRTFFRCALQFDSEFDGLSCTARALNTRNPFSDADLSRYARRLLDLLPATRRDTVTERVRGVLLLLIPNGEATAARAAECLGITVRTLQRQLVSEGNNFSDLLGGMRREMAMRYLEHSSHSVTAIGELIGYSSVSAFTRWFTAVFGKSPVEWRKEQQILRGEPPKALR